MKLRKNESPIWLSEVVHHKFQEQYPQLAGLRNNDGLREQIRKIFPSSFRLALAIFVLGLAVYRIFIWQDWTVFTYKIDSQGAFDIVASSLEYIAGLVGIVLPIILIIVEFVSRERSVSSVIDIYLEKTALKTTAYWALGLLGFEAVLMALFRATIIRDSQALLTIIFLLTLLNLAVIVETGKTIWNLRNSLSNSFLIKTLSIKLAAEIRRSQKTEIENRLGRIAMLNLYSDVGLERSPYNYQSQDTTAIRASKSGVLIDIRLPGLQRLASVTKSSSEKIFLTKLVNDPIKEGEIIAFVPATANSCLEDLRKILKKSYKLSDGPEPYDEVRTLMKQVKQAVEASIREENKLFFDELTSVYLLIFELGIGLPIPPSTEWLSDLLFKGWPATQIAIRHIEDFVEIAAKSGNREYIDDLSYDIFSIAGSMIQNSNVIVDDNLSEVLGLYVTMYLFSHKYNNELGVHLSYFYLTRNVVDGIWADGLRSSIKDMKAVENYKTVLNYILGTLARILKQAISNHDLDTFRTLLNLTQPKELLAYFNLRHSFSHEYQSLMLSQEETSENSIVQDQIRALRLVYDIPKYVQDFFDKFTFLLTSYLLESYERDEITVERFEETLSILKPYLPPLEQSVTIFSQLVESRLPLGWDLFTRYPDTKRGSSPNNEDKLLLFHCVRGMALIRNSEVRVTISTDLKHKLSRIEETCKRIVNASSKWKQTSFFLGLESDLAELAQKWIQLNKEIAQRWQIDYEDQIISCDPDANKIRAFTEGIEQAIQEQGKTGFRCLLERYDKLTIWDNSSEQNPILNFNYPKMHLTTLHENDNIASDLGKECGHRIVRWGDMALFRFWIKNSRSLSTRKDWENFQPYFDRAIRHFSEIGYELSCFLVPNNRHLYSWLMATPGFIQNFQAITEELPMFRGYYKDIPVYEYVPSDNNTQYVLAIDVKKALRMKIGKPVTEIRNFTQEEIKRTLSNNPEKTARELLLSVRIKTSQPFDFELLDREATLRMKLKLSTESDPYS